ncbi:M1 family aminopeptidase [Nonlabens xiamenensis]|uniref:M1 family aminopeptidase n=1 Tax=Nonlabens xiamenensis TaxID=2341043 RepID=UPI000F60515F|nr:M1 family aminopeptidase [Nonlabens xiamenensis]
MFVTIFSHEFRTWLKKPLFYIFTIIFFLLGGLITSIATGVFSSDNVTVTSNSYINSPLAIMGLLANMALLCYLLIPSFTGTTIHRDFKNNMHNLLYSYPIKKWEYLTAKFMAGFSINLLAIAALLLGLMVGTYLPGAEPELVGPFHLWYYIQPFLVIIVPNVLFYSAIVFAIVTFTRNMNIGFMAILTLIIIQLITTSLVDQVDDPFWLAMADPLGNVAMVEMTKYWTPVEQNELLIPFSGMMLWNRLLWSGVSLLILAGILARFKFAQHAIGFGKSKKSSRLTKENISSVARVIMPSVTANFSLTGQLKTLWHLAKNNTRYILFGWPFIIISFLAVALTFVLMFNTGMLYQTSILPKTWVMLGEPSTYIFLFSYLLIHLYAGFLMDRSKAAHINQIVDVTPTKNWIFLGAMFISLFLMVAALQVILILCGVVYQSIQGFTDYQIDLYLFQAFLINVWSYVPWIFLALLVHTLVKNKWLGLAILLIVAVAIPLLQGAIGVSQQIYDFNSTRAPSPSDFTGYGIGLITYYTYRVYWILLALIFFVVTLIFYRRGMGTNVRGRIAFAKARTTRPLIIFSSICLLAFLGIGSYIWKVNNIDNELLTGKERELRRVEAERELGKYEGIPQPRLVAVNTFMDIFPKTRDFKAGATYTMINKHEVAIDTLHVNLTSYPTEIELDRGSEIVYDNEDYDYRMYRLQPALQPGDTLIFKFKIHNKPNKFLDNNSPVLSNGTFINYAVYPSIGYNDGYELRNPKVRKKYDLPEKDRLPSPYADGATDNNYISNYGDWIDFEATLSTSGDQMAIAPGYLIKEWKEDGRNHFHYKMDSKMVNFYSFLSGKYEVTREKYKGVNLEIYHHPEHTYNVNRMMNGLKKGLDYYNANYTPYQHRQARIIEFPKQMGSFAQAFANTIPFSEGIGFIANVDDEDQNVVDYPFSVTAHELAHQWWAHQVIGAKAKGATLLSESLSEYSSLKVLEKENGANQMRNFLKDAMDSYLQGRTSESIKENPLMYNENQPYIHYRKGSVVLYAMSDYLGEKKFNDVAKRFAEKYRFVGPPYPTAPEFVEDLRSVTPDSLQYLIKDMFETITLYDNEVTEATYEAKTDGTYQVNIQALVSKYRSDKRGEKSYASVQRDSLSYTGDDKEKTLNSLPLADYIEVGVFGEENPETGEEEVLFLKKLKVSDIQNNFEITVPALPVEVGIDPYYKLIDRDPLDNRKSPKEKKQETDTAD